VKGRDAPGTPIWPRVAAKSHSRGAHPVRVIGVGQAKWHLHQRLRLEEPGPGYVHLSTDCDPEWIEQLTAERRRTRYDQRGRAIHEWVKDDGARNEVWDCYVYAYAALFGWLSGGKRIDRELALVKTRAASAKRPSPVQSPKKRRRRKPSTWLGPPRKNWLGRR
jgi:phage terminase large subunit GpA-like protein